MVVGGQNGMGISPGYHHKTTFTSEKIACSGCAETRTFVSTLLMTCSYVLQPESCKPLFS